MGLIVERYLQVKIFNGEEELNDWLKKNSQCYSTSDNPNKIIQKEEGRVIISVDPLTGIDAEVDEVKGKVNSNYKFIVRYYEVSNIIPTSEEEENSASEEVDNPIDMDTGREIKC